MHGVSVPLWLCGPFLYVDSIGASIYSAARTHTLSKQSAQALWVVCGSLRSMGLESDTEADTGCGGLPICSSANNMRCLAGTERRSGMKEHMRLAPGRRGCGLQHNVHAVLASSPCDIRPQRIRVIRQTRG
jgi:hypothetical protein